MSAVIANTNAGVGAGAQLSRGAVSGSAATTVEGAAAFAAVLGAAVSGGGASVAGGSRQAAAGEASSGETVCGEGSAARSELASNELGDAFDAGSSPDTAREDAGNVGSFALPLDNGLPGALIAPETQPAADSATSGVTALAENGATAHLHAAEATLGVSEPAATPGSTGSGITALDIAALGVTAASSTAQNTVTASTISTTTPQGALAASNTDATAPTGSVSFDQGAAAGSDLAALVAPSAAGSSGASNLAADASRLAARGAVPAIADAHAHVTLLASASEASTVGDSAGGDSVEAASLTDAAPHLPAHEASASARAAEPTPVLGAAGAATAASADAAAPAAPASAAITGTSSAVTAVSAAHSAAAPGSSATAAPPLTPQLARPIVALAQSAAGVHTVSINVAPDNLGPVTVHAHIGRDGVRIELVAANDASREALRAILPELRRDLAGVVQHSSLSLANGDDPSDNANGFGNGSTGREAGERAFSGDGATGTSGDGDGSTTAARRDDSGTVRNNADDTAQNQSGQSAASTLGAAPRLDVFA